MLDLFCYRRDLPRLCPPLRPSPLTEPRPPLCSGGFSLCAARAGAASCLGVDSSSAAVELAARNAQLNGLEGTCQFTRADVLKFLQDAPPQSDVVICDPPKYAPTIKDLGRAERKYRKLNALAMRAVAPGGLLLSCTCSGAMTQSGGFERMMQDAALAEGRALTLLRRSGAASDHTIHPSYPEGNYLTAVLAVVH